MVDYKIHAESFCGFGHHGTASFKSSPAAASH